ncbi:hypothetical protein [Herpetosiphon giganteus]|uniref:hypothetical protein n=1 Tax=Herpetosiphon giganteus TaxID=2029754 RepID=UPI00195C46FB|nr:hypothetical protein [Herpetosiphon giganteus]MBM7841582.1 hypothetical protein [Herpetosiphon giganteus]
MQNVVSESINSTIMWMIGSFVFAIVLFAILRRVYGPNKKLLQQGLPGQARIINVYETGLRINRNPQIGLVLEISGPLGQYQTETKAVIPMISIPQFQPGAVLPIKIDPSNRNNIALDIYGPQ